MAMPVNVQPCMVCTWGLSDVGATEQATIVSIAFGDYIPNRYPRRCFVAVESSTAHDSWNGEGVFIEN